MVEQRLNQKTVTNKSGFSLIEILVFIMLISLVLITSTALTITAIRNTKNNQYRVLAQYYAESLENWITSQRLQSWTDFKSKTSSAGTTYCFNSTTIDNWPTTGACSSYSLDNKYKREAKLTLNNNDQITAEITVNWKGISGNDVVMIKRIYSRYEF
ncbi:MAG: hypothetical protein KatS3mg090_0917 [Patescibacteria group bacterium]|nr:MAG: hypothetical protein KatS3mg090_0917 [Patescibacteria group bacterium]